MRTGIALARAAAIAAALGLGGCSLFSSDDDSEAVAAEEAASSARFAPVEAVLHIEIGRTRNGYAITARGIAPGVGFGAPELRARRDGKMGPDGFVDFDFIAQAPDPSLNLGEGSASARAIRADLLVPTREFAGVIGIRIHGVSGGLQMTF
ncbi:MAG TPA: hypothetical protein VMY41_08025 [Thermohalobaculum sp.]|nr:hypothetical protein [Thermohalobaculum sp.]